MKTLLSATLATFIACHLPLQAKEVRSGDIVTHMKSRIVEQLRRAQTIALCDFALPGGIMINKILRGDPKRVGELWNSELFPQKPILIFEYSGDHLGEGRGTLLETSYFTLDETKQFIVLESFDSDATVKDSILISIRELQESLSTK